MVHELASSRCMPAPIPYIVQCSYHFINGATGREAMRGSRLGQRLGEGSRSSSEQCSESSQTEEAFEKVGLE